jgi:hypothetical protein
MWIQDPAVIEWSGKEIIGERLLQNFRDLGLRLVAINDTLDK